jgi:PAS domain S-box-containing protein
VFRSPRGRVRSWYFLSLRWKTLLPLLVVSLLVSMTGAYVVSDAVARSVRQEESDRLLRTSRAISDRMAGVGVLHQREITRIAYTQGVAAQAAAGDGAALHPILEPLAAAADLDYVLVADAHGREIVGLQRAITSTRAVDYAVSSGTDLLALAPVQAVLAGPDGTISSAVTRTGQTHVLMTASALPGDPPRGVIVVGTRLAHVLDMVQGGDNADLAFFGADGEFLRTTFPVDDALLATLKLSPAVFEQALSTPGQVPVESLTIDGKTYNAAYLPLVIDGTPLGVVGAYLRDDTLYATTSSRQLTSLVAAGLVGLIVLVAFVVMSRFTRRMERIRRTAHALASGARQARTRMAPSDEIGALGAALDQLADRHQHQADALQKALRRQRREAARLKAVLESIPDGLVVQDLDGRVLLINDAARELMGGQRIFRTQRLHELTAVVTETLGPALAPGIYALGDPTRIPLDGRLLQAQAAAIIAKPDTRIGTVIVLRDITADVTREQTREALLEQLEEQAVVPSPQSYDSLAALAKEVARNTRALQRVIAELRDLSTFEPRDLQDGQRPLPLNDLLWNVAAEWQPLAHAAHMRLQVRFGPRGLFILGDDRRLRWAVGNVLDNALKYSPPETLVSLETRLADDDPAFAELVIEDEGYGIAPEDLDNVFTRFYRGTPRNETGVPVRKPGTGQGLFIARRVIEAHGGEIRLTSQIDAGTTVIIRLPLTAPVTLEISETGVAVDYDTAEVELPKGGPFDTIPLEPRKPPWERDS